MMFPPRAAQYEVVRDRRDPPGKTRFAWMPQSAGLYAGGWDVITAPNAARPAPPTRPSISFEPRPLCECPVCGRL